MSRDSSPLDGFSRACGQFFVAAVALYLAVQYIQAVWFSLLLIVLGVAALIGAAALLRRYLRGW